MIGEDTLFVTVGATVPFVQLVETILKPTFLDLIACHGYSNLRIQHGNSALFNQALQNFAVQVISDNKKLSLATVEIENEHDGCVRALVRYKPDKKRLEKITIVGFPYTRQMAQEMTEAKLVISHAGAGSILDALRLNKRLIVVINTALMDNHQKEIAHVLAQGGHVTECTPQSLAAAFEKSISENFSPLPPPNTKALNDVLLQELAASAI